MAVFRKLDFTNFFFKTLYLTSTWSIHALQHWTNLPIIDPEGIFQIDSFWGKNSFLKKTLSWVDFKEGIELEPLNLVRWLDIFVAPDYWRKIYGLVIFVKIMAVFRKLDFTIFYYNSLSDIHMINSCTTVLDQFTDYWPRRNFSDWVIFGWKTAF